MFVWERVGDVSCESAGGVGCCGVRTGGEGEDADHDGDNVQVLLKVDVKDGIREARDAWVLLLDAVTHAQRRRVRWPYPRHSAREPSWHTPIHTHKHRGAIAGTYR
jgi:hypothetical protein